MSIGPRSNRMASPSPSAIASVSALRSSRIITGSSIKTPPAFVRTSRGSSRRSTHHTTRSTADEVATALAECPDIELILCGSRQHVVMHHDCPPTRMGSGSDWLHDLAAELAASASRDDSSIASSLSSTSLGDQEFAARSAYNMMANYCDRPAYLQGHARVLCNFPPNRFRHRMIVATPLYVEAGQTPSAQAEAQSGPSSPAWRRWLRRPASHQHGQM
ncbi:SAVMC3_10250 family protein [[Kitasatospora] papulosa]|uniref:SAVMC3_10250 family protein n=2 Tax=Streptomyces TaxID=1883 RepID=UPI0036830B76